MTAAHRLRGLGWFGGGTAVVLGFYLVSLQVAAERKRVERVDAQIAGAQRDIRALETEFDTRADLAQLERWNGDTLALSAPQARQFVRDAAQLASMEVVRRPEAPGMRTAALVVPSAAPAIPVAVAQASPAPRPVAASAPAPAQVAAAKPAVPPASVAVAAVRAPVPHVQAVAAVRPRPAPLVLHLAGLDDRPVVRPASLLRPRAQVAMLDRSLLSDATLTQIASGARAERGRLR